MNYSKITTYGIVERLNKINNYFDYSLVEYENMHKKIKIICKKHGIIEQTPNNLLNGFFCKNCKTEEKNKEKKEKIVLKCSKLHNNKYDYSKVEYKTMNGYVIIICPEHGEFSQTLNNHFYNKKGCKKCAKNNNLSLTDFINKSNVIHNNFYDYNKVVFKNVATKVDIICPNHGEFKQTPNNHLNGVGCPHCSESFGEKKITTFLIKNNIKYVRQEKFKDCKDIKTLPFDFYLPEENICVEFDGRQHFEIVEKWGGMKSFEIIKKHDEIKNEFCKQNNIKLIRISYKDDIENILYLKIKK